MQLAKAVSKVFFYSLDTFDDIIVLDLWVKYKHEFSAFYRCIRLPGRFSAGFPRIRTNLTGAGSTLLSFLRKFSRECFFALRKFSESYQLKQKN